jgi:hypothetical protein
MCIRLHINLDEELVEQIDELAGARGRSAFIRETLAKEVEEKRAWAAFRRAAGSCPNFGDHMGPDWVRRMRRESGARERERLRETRARHDDPD